MHKSGLHELTHLAHMKIVNREKHPSFKSNQLREGFAEYISRVITEKDFGIPVKNKTYEPYHNWFKEEVQMYHLQTANDFKNYLLNYNED